MNGARKKIVLLTGNSLCHNPRAVKEATALARRQYEVHVLGGWSDIGFKQRDLDLIRSLPFRFVPVVDETLSGVCNWMRRSVGRAGRKAAHIAYRMAGVHSSLQLGPGVERLMKQALRVPADLYIAHSERGLYVAARLLRAGRRAGVDMEDWFSEDLLPAVRRQRPVRLLASLEAELLVRGAYASCPSRAMSAALAERHGCRAPTVVYNAFEWSQRAAIDGQAKDREGRKRPSIHWFGTTLGPGRGLEDLLAALPLLRREADIHLRGNPSPGFGDWVRARVPDAWRRRIVFHGLVRNDELLSRIAEHDVGFAGEMTYSRSRDLTVTNKILHYLLGGLAVVASDTVGQREVVAQAPDAISLYPSGAAAALAARLDALLASPEDLWRAKLAAVRAAEWMFCWERQEQVLLRAVDRALEQPIPNGPIGTSNPPHNG